MKFAENSTISVEGKGKAMIKRRNGEPVYVIDVLYVPSMKNNLLSLGQLLEKGFTMSMKQNYIEVFDSRYRLVSKAPLSKNRTFKVNLNAAEVHSFSTTSAIDERWLWHYRYGHLNFQSLNRLGVKKMVLGLPFIKPPQKVCKGCLMSKQPTKAF